MDRNFQEASVANSCTVRPRKRLSALRFLREGADFRRLPHPPTFVVLFATAWESVSPSRTLSFRRASGARQEESAVLAVLPAL